jgi:hypothetical protein
MTIDITGGNSVTFSNIAVTFEDKDGDGKDAVGHFGSNPLHGVVRSAGYIDAFGR